MRSTVWTRGTGPQSRTMVDAHPWRMRLTCSRPVPTLKEFQCQFSFSTMWCTNGDTATLITCDSSTGKETIFRQTTIHSWRLPLAVPHHSHSRSSLCSYVLSTIFFSRAPYMQPSHTACPVQRAGTSTTLTIWKVHFLGPLPSPSALL